MSLWLACSAAPVGAADEVVAPPSSLGSKEGISTSIELMAGYAYRTDQFNWDIAGTIDGTDPNILSELTWEDVSVHQFRVAMRLQRAKALYLRSHVHYGVIVEGENQDSDFREDDRQEEFSRSVNQSDKGHTWDISLGIGYPIFSNADSLSLAPVVGFSHHQQELHMTDGYQVIPPQGSFSGLDSSYHAKWSGPWVGVDLNFNLKAISRRLRPMMVFAVYEHHWAEYRATADWNLRTDFQHPRSFEHEANGRGDRWMVGLQSRLTPGASLRFYYEEQRWDTAHGIDRVYLAGGRTVETRLNGVDWRSRSVGVDVVIRF